MPRRISELSAFSIPAALAYSGARALQCPHHGASGQKTQHHRVRQDGCGLKLRHFTGSFFFRWNRNQLSLAKNYSCKKIKTFLRRLSYVCVSIRQLLFFSLFFCKGLGYQKQTCIEDCLSVEVKNPSVVAKCLLVYLDTIFYTTICLADLFSHCRRWGSL